MKKKCWKVETLLTGALALLGFGGCGNTDETPCLYGTPTAEYQVHGTVTDESGNPLENIQVILRDRYALSYYDEDGTPFIKSKDSEAFEMLPDTVYTDKSGNFSCHKVKTMGKNSFKIDITDIDGEANGGDFVSRTLTYKDLKEEQVKEESGFYKGEFKYAETIRLNKKVK